MAAHPLPLFAAQAARLEGSVQASSERVSDRLTAIAHVQADDRAGPGAAVREGPGIVNRHGSLSCEHCHLRGEKATSTNAILLAARQARLCGGCHQIATEASHPVGFRPARRLPPEFPLDRQGKMTCTTCHDPHGTAPGALRRPAAGGSFCLACHDVGFFGRMADTGELLRARGLSWLEPHPRPPSTHTRPSA